MVFFKKKLNAAEFIYGFVDSIIIADNKVDRSNAPYISLNDVRKLKENLAVFRLHLLWILLTITSKSGLELSRRSSLLFEAIQESCMQNGLSEEQSNDFADRVYKMQEQWEKRILTEQFHKEDKFFHACNYFSEYIFDDVPITSDKRIWGFGIANAVNKNLQKAFYSVKLT